MWRGTSTSRFYDKENNSFPYCCFYTFSHIMPFFFFKIPFWSPVLWPRNTCWGRGPSSTQTSSSWGEMQDLSGSIPPTDRPISSLLSCSPPIGWCLVWLCPCHPLNAKPLIFHAQWLGSVLVNPFTCHFMRVLVWVESQIWVLRSYDLNKICVFIRVKHCLILSAVLQDHFSSLTGAARWWGWQTGRWRGKRWSSASGRRQRLLLWLQR